MPISASQIVQVNPRLLTPGGRDLEFNGLLLTKNRTIPSGMVMAFGDPDGVSAYFGPDSDEARLAGIYFLGYNDSFIKPRAFYIAMRQDVATNAWLRSGEVTALPSEFAALPDDSSIALVINGITTDIPSINLNLATSYSDVAFKVERAIQLVEGMETVTVSFTSQFNAFVIDTGLADATVSFSPSSALADMMCITRAGGAVLSQGTAEQTEAANMEAILTQTQNFVNLTTTWLPTKDEVLNFAQWATSKGVNYLWFYSDIDRVLLQPGSTATIAAAIKDANLSATAGQYGGPEYSAFIAGVGASIDWNRRQGTITAAFKSQDGLSPTVENSTDAINLMAQGMNFIGDYATRNDQFIFNYPGQMFGRYGWIDSYWNAVWLGNVLQVALMSGLSQSPRTPYTEQGYALVRAWMMDPVNRALNNGAIEPGVVLSEKQKAQINREAGEKIDDTVFQNGYFIQVLDPGPQARINRESPIVSIWYTYGGSINKLSVSSTAIV